MANNCWIIGSNSWGYMAMEVGDDNEITGKYYDPEEQIRNTIEFYQGKFSEAEARRLVDKMNSKGKLVRIDKKVE